MKILISLCGILLILFFLFFCFKQKKKQKVEYLKLLSLKETLSKEIQKKQKDLDQISKEYTNLLEQQTELSNKILDLKKDYSLTIQRLKEEEKEKEKINFYKLNPTEQDLKEIAFLNNLKPQLREPSILSKLIWTTYFQKDTTKLCNNIIGTQKVCGIYKITNLLNKKSYIGQSVDISNRIKTHIKCGLGIDTPPTNKFYQSLQEIGVWNFSFEVLEKCSKEKLNEKEKYWIDFYKTTDYGYNSTKGGS